jgi:hypothetical protein
MSATPGARDEYSRGNDPSSGALQAASGPAWRGARRFSQPLAPGVRVLVLAGSVVAALLLVAAEFTSLYEVHLATKSSPIGSVTTGSHNSYAMILIAAVAVALGVLVRRGGSRVAILEIGIVGLVALLIALLHDLPDAHAVGLAEHNSVAATTTPAAGMYLETLGAIVLIATSGIGLALAGLPRPRRRTERRSSTRAV